MAYAQYTCSVKAPGKINLHLRVKEKRADGFHGLESLFAAIAFGDTLFFEQIDEGSWELGINWHPSALETLNDKSRENLDLFAENNLVSRAAALFRAKTNIKSGFRCTLEKHIPLGAGLGGGSSDAASALLALNFMTKAGLSREDLLEMALKLGSDVPFFISGGAAWISGRGEHIESIPAPGDFGVLLVKPPFPSNTALAYQCLDRHREKAPGPISGISGSPESGFIPGKPEYPGREDLKNIWALPPGDWPFYNDFLPLLPERESYGRILKNLKDQGALFSGLSGSGSCCFGIFEDKKKAAMAEKALKSSGNNKNFIQLTFFLASGADPVLQY